MNLSEHKKQLCEFFFKNNIVLDFSDNGFMLCRFENKTHNKNTLCDGCPNFNIINGCYKFKIKSYKLNEEYNISKEEYEQIKKEYPHEFL